MRKVTGAPRVDLLPTALHAVTRAFALGEVYDRRSLAHGLMNRNWCLDTASGPYAVKEITDVSLPGLDTALRERRALLTRYADRQPDGEIPAGP